jgi:isocitrate dehydrogenase
MSAPAAPSPLPTQPASGAKGAPAKIAVTVARGDGIGPEIMDATLRVLDACGAGLEYEFIDIGERVYAAGHSSGIAPESWNSLRKTKVFLKAPITTPQGGGFKSLNVTTRKTLGLYANVRPCVAYNPEHGAMFEAIHGSAPRRRAEYAPIHWSISESRAWTAPHRPPPVEQDADPCPPDAPVVARKQQHG